MTPEPTHADTEPYDVIVIGAGLCGLVFLKYASDADLRCLALEMQEDIGGVWNWLPPWQDIQNRREDFSVNGVPLHGVTQPAILRFAREWVREFDLDPLIELQCEVTAVSWTDGGWTVRTNQGAYRSEYLIVASGAQNDPWIPDVERKGSRIVERHSSGLQRPEECAGERVTVVGGGTSSWDLLDLAIAKGAKEVHWVHRSIKWCLPTQGTKQTAWPNLRELAVIQSVLRSSRRVTVFLRWLLKWRYGTARPTDLEPAEPFDIRKHQLIPGREFMQGGPGRGLSPPERDPAASGPEGRPRERRALRVRRGPLGDRLSDGPDISRSSGVPGGRYGGGAAPEARLARPVP